MSHSLTASAMHSYKPHQMKQVFLVFLQYDKSTWSLALKD